MGRKVPSKTSVVFYRTKSGAEVVLNWLRGLGELDRAAIGQDLMRVQYRWPVGMPFCRSLGKGLWEVRVDLPSKRIARLIFSPRDEKLVVLHGFVKKTQKTPHADLELARKRDGEFSVGNDEGDDDGQ